MGEKNRKIPGGGRGGGTGSEERPQEGDVAVGQRPPLGGGNQWPPPRAVNAAKAGTGGSAQRQQHFLGEGGGVRRAYFRSNIPPRATSGRSHVRLPVNGPIISDYD